MLHEIAADCIELGFEPDDFIGHKMAADGFEFEIPEDQVAIMFDAIDWLRERAPGPRWVEQKVSMAPFMPGQYGYLDLAWIERDICFIFDWKFGFVLVRTPDNKQLKAYALGFYTSVLKPMGIHPRIFRLIIEQPRAMGGARFTHPWEISLDDLLVFGDEMAAIMAAADAPDAPRNASPTACFYCRAKEQPGGCYAHVALMLDLLGQNLDDFDTAIMMGDPMELPDQATLTPERRSQIILHAPMIKKWLDQLLAQGLIDGLAGEPIPALKVAEGDMGDRKWVDDTAAEAVLEPVIGEKRFNKKLISPTMSERLFKPRKKHPGDPVTWATLSKLVVRDPAKPVLVSASDPRKLYETVDQKFEDEPET